jgi:TolA-binding protein
MRHSKRCMSSVAGAIVVLAVVALAGIGAFAYQNYQLQSTISSDFTQISSLESNVSSLQTENGNLQTQNANLSDQITSDQNQINSLQAQNANLQNEISTLQKSGNTVDACGSGSGCTLTIWTIAVSLSSSEYYSESVPDTFDYYDVWSSSTPIIVYFLTDSQYVQFVNCSAGISCVSGTYSYDGPATSANYKFALAEGCGGYIAVYKLYSGTSGTLYPDIYITYNPASSTTGACA